MSDQGKYQFNAGQMVVNIAERDVNVGGITAPSILPNELRPLLEMLREEFDSSDMDRDRKKQAAKEIEKLTSEAEGWEPRPGVLASAFSTLSTLAQGSAVLLGLISNVRAVFDKLPLPS